MADALPHKGGAIERLAGADFIVTGNVLEENLDPGLIRDFAAAIHSVRRND